MVEYIVAVPLDKVGRSQRGINIVRLGEYLAYNSEILSKMDSMMSTMESMMENMASSMKNLKVFMDKDKLVGELREDMNIKNEMAATRYTRGRLR